MDALGREAALRLVVLRGNGRHFQAGADLAWISGVAKQSPAENERASRLTAEAIRRLDESGVDLVVVNTRDLTEYGQGAFGDTYYRTIQDWLDSDFRRVASYGNDGETTVALDVWQRRTS